jgi:hypothetical protein
VVERAGKLQPQRLRHRPPPPKTTWPSN